MWITTKRSKKCQNDKCKNGICKNLGIITWQDVQRNITSATVFLTDRKMKVLRVYNNRIKTGIRKIV